MKILKTTTFILCLILITAVFLNACRPIRNLSGTPNTWQGNNDVKSLMPAVNAANKNVFVIADANMTVLFDMIAPFYLFNETQKANVYIIAKDKTPILIKRDLFAVPQLTFAEADSMQLFADVIVIPALSKRDEHQDTVILNWIRNHCAGNTRILAVCDGAATAAATGLFDGKPLTCHASDYASLKAHFSKPRWVKDVPVTKSGNLFSTAGVSNAVEGSLAIIEEMFGRETMQKVLSNIRYPHPEILTTHQSLTVSGANKMTVIRKMLFRKNKHLALLVEDGVNEFEMASIIETYGRTFPASLTLCNVEGATIITRHGLALISTASIVPKRFDEVHVLTLQQFPNNFAARFSNTKVIRYNEQRNMYPIELCLKRIAEQYGPKFENVVKLSLDYN